MAEVTQAVYRFLGWLGRDANDPSLSGAILGSSEPGSPINLGGGGALAPC